MVFDLEKLFLLGLPFWVSNCILPFKFLLRLYSEYWIVLELFIWLLLCMVVFQDSRLRGGSSIAPLFPTEFCHAELPICLCSAFAGRKLLYPMELVSAVCEPPCGFWEPNPGTLL